MKGDNITAIIKSPAFTIFVGTVCVLIIMDRLPVMINTMKAMKKDD